MYLVIFAAQGASAVVVVVENEFGIQWWSHPDIIVEQNQTVVFRGLGNAFNIVETIGMYCNVKKGGFTSVSIFTVVIGLVPGDHVHCAFRVALIMELANFHLLFKRWESTFTPVASSVLKRW